jgi:large subunit ribosomal protein L10
VLLAKLAGAMKASLAGAAATFNALPVQMAQLAEALRAKRAPAEDEGTATASSDATPNSDATASSDATPDTPDSGDEG